MVPSIAPGSIMPLIARRLTPKRIASATRTAAIPHAPSIEAFFEAIDITGHVQPPSPGGELLVQSVQSRPDLPQK